MASEFETAIARLEAQKAEIEMAIAVLRKLDGQSPVGGGPSGGIHSGTFLGKTIPEAARMYLEMCNKVPQKPESIAKALQDGGMETKAANFVAMLQTILRRTERATGEFMRTPAGDWALPEWFGKKPKPKGSGEQAVDLVVAGASPAQAINEALEDDKADAGKAKKAS